MEKLHSRLLVTKLESEFAGVRGVDDHLVLRKNSVAGGWTNNESATWCCWILGCLQDRRITNLICYAWNHRESPMVSSKYVKMANCSSLTQKMCKKKRKWIDLDRLKIPKSLWLLWTLEMFLTILATVKFFRIQRHGHSWPWDSLRSRAPSPDIEQETQQNWENLCGLWTKEK